MNSPIPNRVSMPNRNMLGNSIRTTDIIISSTFIVANNKKRDSIIISDTNPNDINKSLVVSCLLNATIDTTPKNMEIIKLPTCSEI
ncbi:MAG: hypothetical protein WAL66_12045 [Nitrososphaeraceae archaeon]